MRSILFIFLLSTIAYTTHADKKDESASPLKDLFGVDETLKCLKDKKCVGENLGDVIEGIKERLVDLICDDECTLVTTHLVEIIVDKIIEGLGESVDLPGLIAARVQARLN